jgi:putative tricarboxylic transport membrane protein
MLEDNLRRGLILSHGNVVTFLSEPLTLALLLIALVVIGSALLPKVARRREEILVEAEE